MEINKRGLSPVITTVLLIAVVAVLAIIILLWARAFIPESVTKDDRNIDSVCEEVAFEADLRDTEVLVSNNGNIPIYGFEVMFYLEGETNTEELVMNLPQGASGNAPIDVGDATKIKLTPILLGKTGEREVSYLCKNHPGKELTI